MNDKNLSSFEIAHVVRELKSLEGLRIDKAYNVGKELVISTQKGKNIYTSPNACFLLSKKLEFETPSNFAMLLRKHMKGKIINRIYQYKSDRIVIIELEEVSLIIEIFHKGNAILVDKDWNIIMPLEIQRWKDREIKRNNQYKFPESFDIRKPEILKARSQDSLEKALVVNGLGRYAKEVINKAGVTDVSNEQQLETMVETVNSFFTRKTEAMLIVDDKKYLDAIPFPMDIYKDSKISKTQTFSAALEKFFIKPSEKESPYKKKIDSEKRILEQQKKTMANYLEKEKEHIRKADILKRHFAEVEAVLKDLVALKKANKLKDAKELIGDSIVSVDKKQTSFVIRIEAENIELSLGKSLEKSIGVLYDKGKFFRKKMGNITKQMGKVLDKMSILEVKDKTSEKVKEEKKWYHKYRHFVTSDGFLVVAGKDAKTNEMLINKNTDSNDVVMHAEIHGAAFTVIKVGDAPTVTEQAIKEAAQFAACNSKAWPMGLSSVDVFYVSPDQVDKKTNPGEYLAKGAFMVHGKKNYVKAVKLTMACGIVDNSVIVAPLESVSKKTSKFVVIEPGDTPDKKLWKKIKRKLEEKASKGDMIILKDASILGKIPSAKGSVN